MLSVKNFFLYQLLYIYCCPTPCPVVPRLFTSATLLNALFLFTSYSSSASSLSIILTTSLPLNRGSPTWDAELGSATYCSLNWIIRSHFPVREYVLLYSQTRHINWSIILPICITICIQCKFIWYKLSWITLVSVVHPVSVFFHMDFTN